MNIPRHVAVIIDGNRRWAEARGFPKIHGHRYGAEALKKLVPACIQRGLPVVSIFTFSTENWRRSSEEVSQLLNIIGEVFRTEFAWLRDQGVQVRVSGRVGDFPEHVRKIFQEAVEATRENMKLVANFCLGYGGREEITAMVKAIAGATKGDPAAIEAIDQATIERHLYTSGLPDVDLVVRTGGEKRLSGFLPWQTVYAELYFTDVLWPDFDAAELDRALEFFRTRKRNFGT